MKSEEVKMRRIQNVKRSKCKEIKMWRSHKVEKSKCEKVKVKNLRREVDTI